MLRDRLVGVLCLGAAAVAATWGGNGVLERADAVGPAGREIVHADVLSPGPGVGDRPAAAEPEAAPPVTAALPSSTSTSPAPGTTATTAPPGEAPAELARRALLAETDLPAGFTVTTPAPAEGSGGDSPFERCAGPGAAGLTAGIRARAQSATFARADTGSVSSAAVVFDDPATAEKVLGLMTTPSARSCFEGLINARLARNPNLSQDVQGSLGPAPSPALGDGSIAYRFDVRLPAEDVDATARPDDPPVRFVADFLLVRKGRTLVLIEFDNLRQPWADAPLKSVAGNLVAHV